MEKSCRKCVLEASPRFLFVFGNKLKQSCLQEFFFLKKTILKEENQKAVKNLTLFFLPNPVPFNGQDYEKERGSGTGDQLVFRLIFLH